MFIARCVAFLAVIWCAGAHAQSWPSVSTELPKAGGGDNDVAVVVGVSDYPFLPKIPGAADNANDWYQYLVRVRGIPLERVTLLTNADATKERVERALKNAASSSRPSGTAFFIFVGHGAPSPSADDGLLLGADTQADADSLSARGIAQASVASLLSAGKQRDTVLVFDACFSGKTADGKAPLVAGLQATLPVRKHATAAGGTVTLSSSETFAGPLPGQARPAFSYVLLGAMRGWADGDHDKSVTVAEAFSYAQNTLRAALKASDRMPSMRGATGVVLAKNVVEDAPDVQAVLAGRCPEGTRWNLRRCEAVPCPAGTKWDGAACATTALSVKCPTGAVWNGSACTASRTDVACPAGTSWNGTVCAATRTDVACPTGTSWNGTVCSASTVSCPAGTQWDGSACRGPALAAVAAPRKHAEPAAERASAPTPSSGTSVSSSSASSASPSSSSGSAASSAKTAELARVLIPDELIARADAPATVRRMRDFVGAGRCSDALNTYASSSDKSWAGNDLVLCACGYEGTEHCASAQEEAGPRAPAMFELIERLRTAKLKPDPGWLDGMLAFDDDKDGIPNIDDKCKNEPEDFDGFVDDDGCPDADNDRDGIPDVDDACPLQFAPEAANGCEGGPPLHPSGDRDGDGIDDNHDACPDEPEDKDGFQDADGCPDPDNDGDGIPDARDQCPNDPEDKDGFQDEDGCPDPDNDGDGIIDVVDACPSVAGKASSDPKKNGCP